MTSLQKAFLEAVKQRSIKVLVKASKSGLSRKMKFFYSKKGDLMIIPAELFIELGIVKSASKDGYITIRGVGTDMIWHTLWCACEKIKQKDDKYNYNLNCGYYQVL